MKLHLTPTGCHLPYVITQCYLPPDTSEHTPPNPSQTSRYSIYLPTLEGWKAELTSVATISVSPVTGGFLSPLADSQEPFGFTWFFIASYLSALSC